VIAQIKKALSNLGIIIKGLARGDRAAGLPHRDSTLTVLMKECLCGRARATMIATVSPSSTAYVETMSTLKYAERLRSTNALLGAGSSSSATAAAGTPARDASVGNAALSPGVKGDFASDEAAVAAARAAEAEMVALVGQLGAEGSEAARQVLYQTVSDPRQRIAKLTAGATKRGSVSSSAQQQQQQVQQQQQHAQSQQLQQQHFASNASVGSISTAASEPQHRKHGTSTAATSIASGSKQLQLNSADSDEQQQQQQQQQWQQQQQQQQQQQWGESENHSPRNTALAGHSFTDDHSVSVDSDGDAGELEQLDNAVPFSGESPSGSSVLAALEPDSSRQHSAANRERDAALFGAEHDDSDGDSSQHSSRPGSTFRYEQSPRFVPRSAVAGAVAVAAVDTTAGASPSRRRSSSRRANSNNVSLLDAALFSPVDSGSELSDEDDSEAVEQHDYEGTASSAHAAAVDTEDTISDISEHGARTLSPGSVQSSTTTAAHIHVSPRDLSRSLATAAAAPAAAAVAAAPRSTSSSSSSTHVLASQQAARAAVAAVLPQSASRRNSAELARMYTLTAHNTSLQNQLAAARAGEHTAQTELAAVQAALASAQQQGATAADAESRAASATAALAQLTAAYQTAIAETSSLKAQCAELQAFCTCAEVAREGAAEVHAQLETDAAELRQLIAELRAQLQEAHQERASLRADLL
jgi:Kinesin motor domain